MSEQIKKPTPLASIIIEVMLRLNTPANYQEIHSEIPFISNVRNYEENSVRTTLNDFSDSLMNAQLAQRGPRYPILFMSQTQPGQNGANLWSLASDISEFLKSSDVKESAETEAYRFSPTRLTQYKLRQSAIAHWRGKCCVTGIHELALLNAGHIKPWSLCNHTERQDPYNSLLLSPVYDKLFDRALITFKCDQASTKAKICIANKVSKKTLKKLKIDENATIEIHEKAKPYLKIHNQLFWKKHTQSTETT